MLLLDTCVLLWLAADQSKLSSNAVKAIRENAEWLFVSPVSAFEIAIKARKGKLDLPLEPRIWFEKVIRHHGIQEAPLNSAVAFRAVLLPLLHNDPCDRFIIATALKNSMTIITGDSLIAQYTEVKVIW
jgi:PIN domain nuclease of toxin-antitoxin system